MLAVICDHFTGASEIAGVAFAKGYRTVIETRSVSWSDDADVIVIATDMRSMDAADAARKSASLTEELLALGPDLIYKKVDSVLRGNIGPELEAQMRAENKTQALLVPANPTLRREISDGIYYVDGTPVADSGFALNHDFASPTSKVVDILLNGGASNAISVSPGEDFSGPGVHIGNAQNADDLSTWAKTVDDRMVPAGAAEFFAAILDSRLPDAPINGAANARIDSGRTLYICGSNFPSSSQAVDEARRHGVYVADMPEEIYYSDDLDTETLSKWARVVGNGLLSFDKAIIAATLSPAAVSLSGQKISQAMAEVARLVVDIKLIDDLAIEGGATAQAVMAALNVDSLYPVQSLAPGITRMRVDRYPNLNIIMKPGSYQWPESIWKFTG